jgi:transcription elongation factor GreA
MYYLTRGSWRLLRERVEELERRVRVTLAKEIGHAASYGDLSDNAELDAAREKQQLLTLEIHRLREKLSKAQIIDDLPIDGSRVAIGTTVTLRNLDSGEESLWTILGEMETDVTRRVISYGAPLARGLLGKEEGDEVTVQLPSGRRRYEILKVERAPLSPTPEPHPREEEDFLWHFAAIA